MTWWLLIPAVLGYLAEKLTQRQRDLAALSTKAKELGLPVPEEWTPGVGRSDPRAMEEIDKIAQEIQLTRLRNPERYIHK